MQEAENHRLAAGSSQINKPSSSTEIPVSKVETANVRQKGNHRGSHRQGKLKSKNASGGLPTTLDVSQNQASKTQKVAQKSQPVNESAKTIPKGSPESSEPRKSKPRPGKSERAKIQAAKASVATVSPSASTGVAELASKSQQPLLSTAPVPISSPTTSFIQEAPTKAIPSKPIEGEISKSTSNPIQKKSLKGARSKSQAWKTTWMLKETTGSPIRNIDTLSLEPDTNNICSTEGFNTLCTYNWQNDGTIYVPGSPPKWNPPSLPVTLAQDTGRQFVDQNAARVPKYPFEPVFRALSIMNPNTNLNAIDIVVNRNSLRKLLDLAAGKKLDPFCMGLNMINNTLVISRKERSAERMIHGVSNSGYGHTFEHTFTTPEDEMSNSSSHHRVIRYHIGPLNCVVRFEVDAYYDDPSTETTTAEHDTADPLTEAMAKLAVAEPSPPAQTTRRPNPADKPTIAVERGTFIPPSKLAEIKARKGFRLFEAMPQLWFGRTPYFINGNHDNGTVHSVTISHAAAQFAQWETANQERLRRMVSLLVQIKSAMCETRNGAGLLVYDTKGGPLKMYQAKNGAPVLPKDIIGKYWAM
ncbi:hypothetical protein yc1106_00735 [Curvularia clavata]|uniref:Geranylgeranyl pyrophosphate synthetase n=1 Tax=Curvularia clavata TaxID=95742 RepID=A0A9Q9DPM1_CURCL|nr:hypothetical protein yc1106_00735 [Curvularia clavata]